MRHLAYLLILPLLSAPTAEAGATTRCDAAPLRFSSYKGQQWDPALAEPLVRMAKANGYVVVGKGLPIERHVDRERLRIRLSNDGRIAGFLCM